MDYAFASSLRHVKQQLLEDPVLTARAKGLVKRGIAYALDTGMWYVKEGVLLDPDLVKRAQQNTKQAMEYAARAAVAPELLNRLAAIDRDLAKLRERSDRLEKLLRKK